MHEDPGREVLVHAQCLGQARWQHWVILRPDEVKIKAVEEQLICSRVTFTCSREDEAQVSSEGGPGRARLRVSIHLRAWEKEE